MAGSLVWFRQDLRLADNPALHAAAALGAPVTALYVLDDETPDPWKMGEASRWWLHGSLSMLAEDLRRHGIALVLKRGAADRIVPEIVREAGAGHVFWNRCYEPYAIGRDTTLKAALTASGVTVQSFNPGLLHEPERVRTASGTPFRVFTPFYRAISGLPVAEPLRAPGTLQPGPTLPSDDLDSWRLLPKHPDWAGGLRAQWKPGEAHAKRQFSHFAAEALEGYASGRDHPGREFTSRLSPHLHFGEVSARQVWHALAGEAARRHLGQNVEKYRSELCWREFAAYSLYHVPTMPEQAIDPRFRNFPYRHDAKALEAWQRGLTGYPFIDAGMRQLWETGWMHNRVRLGVASFLVKHLGISWREGEAWFWDTLVDADLASNALGWQWVGGSGLDAAPYYRIFNPLLQSAKFDAEGGYIRRFVPELAKLPSSHIHAPWLASAPVLAEAGVRLGETYPMPIVDHATAREAALARYHEA